MSTHSIIIIDDNEIDLELLANIVSDIPDTLIKKFQSSTEALQFLSLTQNQAIDLVLCDFEMPQLNGLDTLIAFRKMNKHTPFMFITAHATIERARDCKKQGAVGFIVKPYTSYDLLSKVEKLLAPNTTQ